MTAAIIMVGLVMITGLIVAGFIITPAVRARLDEHWPTMNTKFFHIETDIQRLDARVKKLEEDHHDD
jgi:outer membrane murein-binding lipoprotein Lpp